MRFAEIKTEGSVLFVGTVGEEGSGNLRGARHLLTAGKWAKEIDAFISFDGADVEPITNGALGSRRYRVELTGTGGHSWGDFGVPNPCMPLDGPFPVWPRIQLPPNREQRSTWAELKAAPALTRFRAKRRWR
jgi:hypothetical protein